MESNKKVNIAELLEKCPKGMKLYSPIFGEVYLDKVRPHLAVIVTIDKEQSNNKKEFLYDGRYAINGECMLFPSKDKDTWEGFVPPCKFKNGDIISDGNFVAIFYKIGTPCGCISSNVVYYHCYYSQKFCKFKKELDFGIGNFMEFKYATKEEKDILFSAIKANSYKWNDEKKCIERIHIPKFKVGDRIKSKVDEENIIFKIQEIQDNDYIVNSVFTWKLPIKNQEDFELVTNKFDINTLNPFNEVLVRNYNTDEWGIDLFGYYSRGLYHTTGRCLFRQCIPYKGNEYLRGTAEDCEEYFKTWE